jgi:signal transduction histidine kinase
MSALTRRRFLASAAALAVAAGVTLFNRLVVRSGPPADALLVMSASITIALVAYIGAEWPRSRARIVALSAAAGVASLVATSAHLPREAPQDAFWIIAEVMALLTLLVLVARWSPARSAVAAGTLVGVAAMATMWRITVPSPHRDFADLAGALLNWSFGVVLAAGLGLYLRTLDVRRSRSVIEARRAQRLEIARDLHDFVAHDVTGMVVQAQAANVVAERDPKEAIAALGRIEDAGLRALGSLDHTVKMLGDLATRERGSDPIADERSTEAFRSRRFGLEDVLGLIGRFATTDVRRIRLRVDTSAEPRIPPEVVSVAYRVILEALTNVRRHAAGSARVDVSLEIGERGDGSAFTVRVTNDAAIGTDAAPFTPLRGDGSFGGRGLAQLEEVVEDVGGILTAGPVGAAGSPGWQVSAVLPLRREARS